MKTSEIENLYDHWYKKDDEGDFERIQSGWRKLSAFYKAKNIAKYFNPKNNLEILDIGGGMGEVSKILHEQFSYPKITLVEISQDAVLLANSKTAIKKAFQFDGYYIPLPDRSIDFGFATHVLEHVPDPRRFLQEIHRVCKKVFIEVPIDFSENIPTAHLLSYGHVNVFSPSVARFLIESEGFKIDKEYPSNSQRKYHSKFYNHFYIMKNRLNIFTKSKFFLKHFLSKIKRILLKSYPSEYCFLITPNDEFEIVSLVDKQRKL